MEAQTRDFGTVTYQESDKIQFVEPLFGFAQYHEFLLLYDEKIGSQFAWLQSLEEQQLCFILTDPDLVDPAYKAKIPESACAPTGEGACECWVVTVIPENFADATVNLKSPILINQESRRAVQVILEADLPIRCRLQKRKNKEEAQPHADLIS